MITAAMSCSEDAVSEFLFIFQHSYSFYPVFFHLSQDLEWVIETSHSGLNSQHLYVLSTSKRHCSLQTEVSLAKVERSTDLYEHKHLKGSLTLSTEPNPSSRLKAYGLPHSELLTWCTVPATNSSLWAGHNVERY